MCTPSLLSERIESSKALNKTNAAMRRQLREKPELSRYLRVSTSGLLRVHRAKIRGKDIPDGNFLLGTSDPSIPAADMACGQGVFSSLAAQYARIRGLTRAEEGGRRRGALDPGDRPPPAHPSTSPTTSSAATSTSSFTPAHRRHTTNRLVRQLERLGFTADLIKAPQHSAA